jgi:hypothetical protein
VCDHVETLKLQLATAEAALAAERAQTEKAIDAISDAGGSARPAGG